MFVPLCLLLNNNSKTSIYCQSNNFYSSNTRDNSCASVEFHLNKICWLVVKK